MTQPPSNPPAGSTPRYTKKRLYAVMEKQQLHSEHAAVCWLDARRQDLAQKRRNKKLRQAGFIISTRAG